jgi:hypothetical protein
MPGLTMPEARVLLAIVSLLTTYSRVEDTVSNRQLRELTGMDDSAVRKALRSLASRGVITRVPGSTPKGGRQQAALIGLPLAAEVSEVVTPGHLNPGSPPPGVQYDPGTPDPHDPGSRVTPALDPGSAQPSSEKYSEKTSEEGAAALTIARRLVAQSRDELPLLLSQMTTKYSADDVLAALVDLDTIQARYPFPSALRTAVDSKLADTLAAGTNDAHLKCSSCRGYMAGTYDHERSCFRWSANHAAWRAERGHPTRFDLPEHTQDDEL